MNMTNIDNNKCPECGADLVSIVENGSNLIKCSKCEWAVASTYNGPEYSDNTIYHVYIVQDDDNDVKKIKSVAKICGVNFIQAKAILQAEKTLVAEGLAYKVRDKIKQIRESNVKYMIEPEYRY